ncbi:methyltransferase type 11 [Salinarchaeum sp. Harcht-Bsk1]|uniref:methyltransferase domain-containing protein n=1 Tax=Salinarchaeum sp. Harcht-Bsk1 TaxID=1333523 RepID=UPI00034228AC|nr:methyltransferase domain-containing protein [Salinarchaeum sp. Harcht-Bsk1]AGN01771.1 methyltransferase type 11 [Salinarchaeum sp. Harcht-Bsk1]
MLPGGAPSGRAASSLGDAEFLARTDHRVAVLAALADGPKSRRELEALADVSRTTVGRTLTAMAHREWVERDGDRFEATPLGEFVADSIVSLLDDLETTRRLRDVWELLPVDEEGFDVVLSNGVINLSPEKGTVFAEANRVLRSGGRLAISDIISETTMPDSIKTDADLWAACIGGAMQINTYREAIEAVGLDVVEVRENPLYEFTSDRARGACEKYGVKSVSLGALHH